MPFPEDLIARTQGACELCNSAEALSPYTVAPQTVASVSYSLLACAECQKDMDKPALADAARWQAALTESMWSTEPPVQVSAWRMLNFFKSQSWAADALDMLYLDEDTLEWAKKGAITGSSLVHKDCNGAVLSAGDNVTLIKNLDVKGANFTAKRGTPVRSISLVQDNDGQIEGRVNGQQIVILTQYVKKA